MGAILHHILCTCFTRKVIFGTLKIEMKENYIHNVNWAVTHRKTRPSAHFLLRFLRAVGCGSTAAVRPCQNKTHNP